MNKFAQNISIGIIQTTLDAKTAWQDGPKMNKTEEAWAVYEIQMFLASLYQDGLENNDTFAPRIKTPELILLPELSVPQGLKSKLKKIAEDMQSIIVAGLDYNTYTDKNGKKLVRNEAIIIIPPKWRGKKINRRTFVRYIGKTYPAPKETQQLEKHRCEFDSVSDVWIFDGEQMGKFGIAICYDLLDLERLAMYRGQIQHLFILAYNQDTTSFYHAAEAMSRMIFCNVVICNCGHFGGSLAVSPYKRTHERTIYRHSGSELATSQVITLPVKSLVEHQIDGCHSECFKNPPSGYSLGKKGQPLKQKNSGLKGS